MPLPARTPDPPRPRDPTADKRSRRLRERRERGRGAVWAEIDPAFHPAWLIQNGYLDPEDYDGPHRDDALAKAIGDFLDDQMGHG
jgi:hypothetical protein